MSLVHIPDHSADYAYLNSLHFALRLASLAFDASENVQFIAPYSGGEG